VVLLCRGLRGQHMDHSAGRERQGNSAQYRPWRRDGDGRPELRRIQNCLAFRPRQRDACHDRDARFIKENRSHDLGSSWAWRLPGLQDRVMPRRRNRQNSGLVLRWVLLGSSVKSSASTKVGRARSSRFRSKSASGLKTCGLQCYGPTPCGMPETPFIIGFPPASMPATKSSPHCFWRRFRISRQSIVSGTWPETLHHRCVGESS